VSDVLIRMARFSDVPTLATLHLQVWDEAYRGLIDAELLRARHERPRQSREDVWRKRVGNVPTWVAQALDGTIVGWIQAGPGRDQDRTGLELMSLYVVASVYSTGVGHALLVEGIGDEPAYLWVLQGNLRAIGFYQRHGFRFDGATKDDPPYGTEARMIRP
jgi:GNAT superfamily N-acetyltransferase